jgi:hypothetical protein
MIHYHGGPITRVAASLAVWKARHAMVSFAWPEEIELAAEICQSFALDNGAFTFWKAGGTGKVDVKAYADWVRKWCGHPGFDWAIIPDVVDGGEKENDFALSDWLKVSPIPIFLSVPVWHMHESNERLFRLCRIYSRVALGSSGEFSEPGNDKWWQRMGDAMDAICSNGIPAARLHGLRMLNPTIFSQLPLSSADSTNVARNLGLDSKWESGVYTPKSAAVRALVLVDRIEAHASAATWQRTRGNQCNLELIG